MPSLWVVQKISQSLTLEFPIFLKIPPKTIFKNNQSQTEILKIPKQRIFSASRNFFFFFWIFFPGRWIIPRSGFFFPGRGFIPRSGIFFFFFRFGVWRIFFFFSSTLHLWLTCQNTFKNHENLPTCILDFIEQDCEVSYKISKQIVRYRLSKIARTAEGVLLSPNLHLWLTYQNTFKFALLSPNLLKECFIMFSSSVVLCFMFYVLLCFVQFSFVILLCFMFYYVLFSLVSLYFIVLG